MAAGVLLAYLGGCWAVAWHVDVGQVPAGSPPHLLLYCGLLTILAACAVSAAAGRRRGPQPGGTVAPRGPRPTAVIAAAGAGLAMAAGPLGGAWQRMYGLDVTLWSPPQLLLMAGIALAALGVLAGYTWRGVRYDPARVATLWRATRIDAWPLARGEAGLYVAAGLLLAIVTGVLAEYDFDVAGYPAVYHPILLCGLGALVLTVAVRAAGRAGGATLAAAAYTAVRLVAQLELVILTGLRPQIPLLLVAAPVLDLALWRLSLIFGRRWETSGTGSRTWPAAPIAGAAFAGALLLVQWPYTVAANTVVWGPDALALATFPSLLTGAGGALAGWWLGAVLRPIIRPLPGGAPAPPLPQIAGRHRGGSPAGSPPPAIPRLSATPLVSPALPARTSAAPLVAVALAFAGLCLVAIFPALGNSGKPPAWPATTVRRNVVGTLELSPAVPIAGQPLTVRLTITDPFLIAGPTLLPFESARLGEVATGNLRAGSQPGVYEGTFTPREPGRRWLSAFLQIEETRTAATASFVVYRPQDAPAQAPQPARPVVLRPQPGPDPTLPPWLRPLTYAIIAGLVAGTGTATALALRRAAAIQFPVTPR